MKTTKPMFVVLRMIDVIGTYLGKALVLVDEELALDFLREWDAIATELGEDA